MHDHIFHLGVVDGTLGVTAPGVFGRFIVGKDADDMDARQIIEVDSPWVLDAAAEHEVKLAHPARASGPRRDLPA